MAADENLTTSRLLNKLAHDISTKAATITTASDDSLLVYDTSVGKVGKVALSALTVSDLGAITVPIVVGSDGTGHDVLFYSATASKSWLWDESADKMIVTGATDLLGATQQTGAFTVGVSGTGHDVIFYGDTASMNMTWDESADALLIRSTAAAAFSVGAQAAAANPAFTVDAATGSQAAGLKVTGATAAGTVALASISSGAAANLSIDAKGTGTIGIGATSTGAVTITPATTVTGAITPTGGVAAAGGFSFAPRLVHTGDVPAQISTEGTDLTVVVTELYVAELFIPANCTVTGAAVFWGSATEGNAKVALYDSTGARVAISASTDVSAYSVDSYGTRIAFTAPYAAKGPATYFLGVIADNTGNRINTHILGNFGAGKITGLVYATEAGYATISPPTTFTTGLGPIASLY